MSVAEAPHYCSVGMISCTNCISGTLQSVKRRFVFERDGLDARRRPKRSLQDRYRLATSPDCACLKPDEVRGRARFDAYELVPVKAPW